VFVEVNNLFDGFNGGTPVDPGKIALPTQCQQSPYRSLYKGEYEDK
jgi:hypothetical protein